MSSALTRLAAGVAALTAAVTFPVVTASPATAEDSVQLQSGPKRCLEIKDGSSENNAPLQQNSCSGEDWQRFTFEKSVSGYKIKTFAGKCLMLGGQGKREGSPIVQNPCDTPSFHKDFRLHAQGDLVAIALYGFYLQVKDYSTLNGAPVVLGRPAIDGSVQFFKRVK
ncbi:RICIN domain-containing protein [Streptomyces salinarius]|uniref:RICIN domain-containing protein n=1 Tax=Streptomyces salinarius TaxID=2762598 RepID=UPI0032DF2A37